MENKNFRSTEEQYTRCMLLANFLYSRTPNHPHSVRVNAHIIQKFSSALFKKKKKNIGNISKSFTHRATVTICSHLLDARRDATVIKVIIIV